MFEQTLAGESGRTARPYTVTFSAFAQCGAIAAALLAPLLFIEPLPFPRLQRPPRMAMALMDTPRPAHRAAPSAFSVASARTVRIQAAILTAPRRIPAGIATLIEDPAPALDAAIGGGGIPFAGSDFANGLLLGGGPASMPAPPAKPMTALVPAKPSAAVPVRVGGVVRPPRLVSEIRPAYPPLARQARIQGTVRMDAILGRDGAIRALRLLSGHPLLAPAAMTAAGQWRYEPTLLNGEPVEVAMTIEVHFTLNH